MTTAIRSSQDQDARLLDQKDKIKAIYLMLHDIPDEKSLFDERVDGLSLDALYQDPHFLRWMAMRIKTCLRDSNLEFQEAMTRASEGILDLSHKNLCDLTIKDFSAPLLGIWKVNLSGNFLRTLPPFLAQKPYISSIDAVGNLEDIALQFHDYRRHNQVSLDLLETLKGLLKEDFEDKELYTAFFTDVATNLAKATIPELGLRLNAFFELNPVNAKKLEIHPESKDGFFIGGIKGFVSLESFPHLQVLDLGYCQLEHRSPINWLADLDQLQVLKLNNTPIKEFPVSLQGKKLIILDLSATQIRNIPDWLGSMDSLKKLYLNDSPVMNWPESMKHLALDEVTLDRTMIHFWPKLHREVLKVSICGTSILCIPSEDFAFLHESRVVLDEDNHEDLKLQFKIYRRFQHRMIAQIVFTSELFKKDNKWLASSVKTHVVALEYITMMGFLSAFQLLRMIILPGPMMCSKRNGFKSKAFQDFTKEKVSLGLSLFYLYFLFHFQPVQKIGQDTKALARLTCRK